MKAEGLGHVSAGKRLRSALAGALLAAVCLGVFAGCSGGGKSGSGTCDTVSTMSELMSAYADYESYDDDGQEGQIKVDTITRVPGAGNMVYINDSAYLDEVFGPEEVSLEDLYAAVDQNPNISGRFKALIREYCTQYVKNAPHADRRILCHNLKTLVVKEGSSYELALDSFSGDAAACYVLADNVITVLSEYTFDKGTWEYQIIFHELSHAARYAKVKTAEHTYEMKSGGPSFREVMCDETLNTIFAVSLMDYEERDLAYQLQSNLVDILVDSMDNYEISDYINHSQSYFIRKLDEYGGYEDYAAGMIRLLQAQYDDFHDDSYKREQSDYYPLYDFVSDVYYRDRIGRETPYAEAERIAEELIDRVSYDVPEEYELDLEHFREHFRACCESLGIS